MTRLGRRLRSTVSKSNILQSLNYRGGFAPPTSQCRDFFTYLKNLQKNPFLCRRCKDDTCPLLIQLSCLPP